MSTIQLDAREQRLLLQAQEALLSPLAVPDPRDWQLRANDAVRDFVGADHSGFSVPTREDTFPPFVSDDSDPRFPDRLYEYIEITSAPDYTMTDPYVAQAVRKRLEGGLDAYHLDQLVSPEQQARSQAIQKVFVPAGMSGMMGVSLPLPEGPEATQFVGFESRNDPGYSERGLRKLRLLVPAFAAGVRTYRRWFDREREFYRTLDRLAQPTALFGADGTLLHRNRALETLLTDEPEVEEVAAAVDGLAEAFARRGPAPKHVRRQVPIDVDRRLRTATASYRLWASLAPTVPAGKERILVQVEREGLALPAPESIEASHGLSARQAEVALLLARGYSDKAIARHLGIAWHTARTHVRNVLAALDLSSRAEVALALLRPPAGENDRH